MSTTAPTAAGEEPARADGKNWRPPKKSAKALLATPKKKSWAVQFIEFRAFGECVLDYLRSQVCETKNLTFSCKYFKGTQD
jgi:hypothetical protein